jgi:hypothetical protein
MYKKCLRLVALFITAGLLIVLWFSWCTGASIARATAITHYVAPAGACGGVAPCYASVQAAVDAASPGDEIRIAAGVYTGVSSIDGHTQLVYIDKSITLRGGYETASWTHDPAAHITVLDAQKQGHVLYITGDIAPLIEGLKLTNGSSTEGGGVYILSAAAVLQHNAIFSNTATNLGGGLYLQSSHATILENRIYSNTTGDSGHGGGVALSNSPAILNTNVITGNRAHAGGGIELQNNLPESNASLKKNLVQGNTAFDYQVGPITYDGAGGGINITSGYTDTLQENLIQQNSAKWGGGLHLFNAPSLLFKNTIQENHALIHGGGLYVQGNQPSIVDNQILTNTAESWGGGMLLWVSQADIRKNVFLGNTAHWRGGGLYTQSAARFDSNIFLNNSADEQGGAIFIIQDDQAYYLNSVLVGNHATEGGAMYLWGAVSKFANSTISSNSSLDGRAVVIEKYPGWADPTNPNQILSQVEFTNTIISTQTVGIYATEHNTLTVNSILWNATLTTTQALSASLAVEHEYSGDPGFNQDGYHLANLTSPAVGMGVNTDLDHDLDGNLYFVCAGLNLGADTLPRRDALELLKKYGMEVQVEPQGIGFGLDAPALSFQDNMELEISVKNSTYECGCPQSSNAYWLGCNVATPDFFCDASQFPNGIFAYYSEMYLLDLLPYSDGVELDTWPFPEPVTLTFSYPDSFVTPGDESLLGVYTTDEPGIPLGTWNPPSCGPAKLNPDTSLMEIPICHLSRYVFGVRPFKVYLPFVLR